MKSYNEKKEFKLSICMIVKNEEKFLDRCLNSLKPLIDESIAELIIVDTGSTDKTIEIASKYTKKIYFKEWNNNFSEARNYSISFAKGEYIFIMDADQEMEYSEVKKLMNLFKGNEYKKYNTYSLVYKNFTNEELSEFTYFSLNLIFKNDGEFKYSGRIHNQPLYKEPVKNLEIYMLHYGYIMTEDVKERKFLRTATLLKEEIKKDPTNIYYIYQLSRSYEMHGDNNEAIKEVEKYIELLENEEIEEIFLINYYHNAAIIYFNAKEYSKCKMYCEKMKCIDKELIDSHYLLGKCNIIEGNIDEGVMNLHLYLKYHNKFRYEKYAESNALEIFSFGEKYNVVSELLRLKNKFNQFVNIEEYINFLMNDIEKFKLIVYDILTISIKMNNIEMINSIIKKMKVENEEILLIYIMSTIIVDNNIKMDKIQDLINILNDNEKEKLNYKIEKENKDSLENLIDFIKENKENNNVIKVESCLLPIINTLKHSNTKKIINNEYSEDIIYIMKFLLSKSDMIINAYMVDKVIMLQLFYKYEEIMKCVNLKGYENDREFVNNIELFRNSIKEGNIVKGMKLLKKSAILINDFSTIITMFKDEIILNLEKSEKSSIDKIEIDKLINNIKLLINNNMIQDAMKLYESLEEFYNVKSNEELLLLKGIIQFYNNKLNEAIETFKIALKYYPNNLDLLYNIAYLYEHDGKYLTSMKYYIDASNINKDYIQLHDDIERINKKLIII